MWIFKFLVFCIFLIWVSAEEDVTLDIRQGTLKGLKATTITAGKPYFSFKGIPYAQPNVGPNKFRVSGKKLFFTNSQKKKKRNYKRNIIF